LINLIKTKKILIFFDTYWWPFREGAGRSRWGLPARSEAPRRGTHHPESTKKLVLFCNFDLKSITEPQPGSLFGAVRPASGLAPPKQVDALLCLKANSKYKFKLYFILNQVKNLKNYSLIFINFFFYSFSFMFLKQMIYFLSAPPVRGSRFGAGRLLF
jgi:hypothetical protein